MQRTAFVIAVMVVASTVVSLCGLDRGREARRASQNAEISLRKCSPEIDRVGRPRNRVPHAMERCHPKKDGYLTDPLVGDVIDFSWGQVRNVHWNAEFRFDMPNTGDLGASPDVPQQDGRIRYAPAMERWLQEKLLFDGHPVSHGEIESPSRLVRPGGPCVGRSVLLGGTESVRPRCPAIPTNIVSTCRISVALPTWTSTP